MDGLPWDHIGSGTGWTLAVGLGLFIVRQISTGNWVTRREHGELLKTLHIKDQQIAELLEHNRLLGEVGRTVDRIMRSFQKARRPVDIDGSD